MANATLVVGYAWHSDFVDFASTLAGKLQFLLVSVADFSGV